ncbi:SDR family oxidoreductase [Novosphingobium panipatense]
MTKPLAGKVALVTGASSGIGEAAALCLAEAGATVALSARRVERLSGLVTRIEAEGGKALAIPGDMTVEDDARRAVAETVAQLGSIDILINSAGIMEAGGIENCDTAIYRKVIDINLMGTVYTCAAAVPHMLEQGGGDIITISSLAGRKGGPMTSAYSASKHAVNFMTDGMRQELGGKNIRVTTLMPGATETEVETAFPTPTGGPQFRPMSARKGR